MLPRQHHVEFALRAWLAEIREPIAKASLYRVEPLPLRHHGLRFRDDQWERIKDFLPGRKGPVGSAAADNLQFVDAVLYGYRTGVPWRGLPVHFGDLEDRVPVLQPMGEKRRFERIFKLLVRDPATNI